MSASQTLQTRGRLQVFGYEPTEAELTLIPRTAGWRGARAGPLAGGGLALAVPLVLFPPHGAWSLASGLTGLALGWRKWTERFTLVRLTGNCPRCETRIVVEGPTRFRNGGDVDCTQCHNPSILRVPEEDLVP